MMIKRRQSSSSLSTWRSILVLVSALIFALTFEPVDGAPAAFIRPIGNSPNLISNNNVPWTRIRGGSLVIDDDDEDEEEEEEDEEEEDEDEEEEEEEPVKKSKSKKDEALLKSTVKHMEKQESKKRNAVKEQLSAKLSSKSNTVSLWQRVPYIIRAGMNPFTVWTMTQAYFASLFSLNYLEKKMATTSSSSKSAPIDLRAALENKAAGGGGKNKRRKRKFKPGQAKTLSDLPQLNT